MKQDNAKSTPKWLLPVVIAAAVLVVAGILLAIFLGGNSSAGSGSQSDLYWNVDRSESVDPETGMSTREPGADGLYTIRFAVNGEQVDLKATDKRLVNSIDVMDVMGLVFDADGLIIEAVKPTDIHKEVAKDYYVKSVSEDKLVVNSTINMDGTELEIPLTGATGIYNVDPTAKVVGQKDTCQIMDKILVYGTEEGKATYVFITQRARGNGVFFRIDRYYDSATGETTRVPDEEGVYSIPFAFNGQVMQMLCLDKDLVSEIDSLEEPKSHMGLIVDKAGMIIGYCSAGEALRGKLLCSKMSVTEVNGSTVKVEDFVGGGATAAMDLTIDAKCDIFLTEDGCGAEFVGQRVDSLQVGDLIYVYSDLEGKPILIYISRRVVEADMYYNMSRQYDSVNLTTKRKADDAGWYVFDMVTKGKRVELRTQDKDLATKVDSFQYKLIGLKVDGTTILEVYDPYCLSGYSHVGIGRYVTEVTAPVYRIVSSTDFERATTM